MGILSRLLGRRRGPLADDSGDVSETPSIPRPQPTPSMRRIETPRETPTTKPLDGARPTAGTRSYGTPHGTPSTERIHNPTRPGR